MFSICALLYGDHLPLAKRCLDSIVRHAEWEMVSDIRVGLNAVGADTLSYVMSLTVPCPLRIYSEVDGRNVYKYPLMRRMFYDPDCPLPSRVMWFDDDSYFKPEVNANWWLELLSVVKLSTVIGSIYTIPRWRTGQVNGIRFQPWYRGQRIKPVPTFCTGGWWVADTAFLTEFDYPFKELIHNNGDVLLGELCNQQGRTLRHFNRGVAINTKLEGGAESSAKRRGESSLWPWQNGYQYDPAIHAFRVRVIVKDTNLCSPMTSSGST